MTEKDKIKQYLEYKGFSKNSFYVKTGLSLGFLDSGKSMGADKVRIIINTYPDLNLEWLVLDNGPMIKPEKEETSVNIISCEKSIHSINTQEVPLYDISAAAGCIMLFQDSNNMVPIDTIKIPNLAKCDGAVFARGDSMYPIIKSGDIILYKALHGLDYIIWGETYIVCYEAYGDYFTVVKYVKKSTEHDGNLVLLSHNEHHQPFEIHISQVKSMALVRASVRYNNM